MPLMWGLQSFLREELRNASYHCWISFSCTDTAFGWHAVKCVPVINMFSVSRVVPKFLFSAVLGKKFIETIDTRMICHDSVLCVFVQSLCKEATEILIAFCFVRHHIAVVWSVYPFYVPKTRVVQMPFIYFNTKWLVEWSMHSQRSQNSLHKSRKYRAVRQFTIQAIVEEGDLKCYSGLKKRKTQSSD